MKCGLAILLFSISLTQCGESNAQDPEHPVVGKWVMRQESPLPQIRFGTPPKGSRPVIWGEDRIVGYYAKGESEVLEREVFEFNADGTGKFWSLRSAGNDKGLAFHWVSALNENGHYQLFAAFESQTEQGTRPLLIINATKVVNEKSEFSLVKNNSMIGHRFPKIKLVRKQPPRESLISDSGSNLRR